MSNKPFLIKGQPIKLPPLEEMIADLAKSSKVSVIPGRGMIIESNNLSEVAKQLGRRGGQKTASLYGKGHFKKIAKGWPKGKKRKPLFTEKPK